MGRRHDYAVEKYVYLREMGQASLALQEHSSIWCYVPLE